MKITAVHIYDCKLYPHATANNLVLLLLQTDQGIEGLGEVSLAYGAGATAAVGMLRQLAERFLLGADPMHIEQMWNRLFRGTFWGQGGGPVLYGAMSAIDAALWDIKGKLFGVPAWELLGGRVNDRLRLYANGWYSRDSAQGRVNLVEPAEYAERALAVVADGYTAIKFDPFVVLADGRRINPPRQLPREQADLAMARVAAVREAVGSEIDIMVEAHGNLGATSAIEIGRRLEEYHPFFFEEPVDATNVEAMAKVVESIRIPVAAGERLYTRHDFRPYIERQLLAVIQPDMGLAGGLSEVKKIAAYAETYDIHVQPHNCAGPVSTAMAVQLDTCITNFIIQEWFPYRDARYYELVEHALDTDAVDGFYRPGDTPGLGVTLNREVAQRYEHLVVR
ncbi:MAG: mandelate racemase/muconate lactonizing enzyme family protein [Anaerolineae bacterium]